MDAENPSGTAAQQAANSALVRDFGLLLKAATRLELRIDTELRRRSGISHTMFEVLLRLCRRPGERVSQRHLADDLTLTSGGVTRLVDRMEEAGLVRRAPSPDDRRSVLVEPTPDGYATFLDAAAVHAEVVQRYFAAPVSDGDYTRLTGALGEINRALADE